MSDIATETVVYDVYCIKKEPGTERSPRGVAFCRQISALTERLRAYQIVPFIYSFAGKSSTSSKNAVSKSARRLSPKTNLKTQSFLSGNSRRGALPFVFAMRISTINITRRRKGRLPPGGRRPTFFLFQTLYTATKNNQCQNSFITTNMARRSKLQADNSKDSPKRG